MNTPTQHPQFLTHTQAAAKLGVNRVTLARWRKNSLVKGWQTPTGQWRYQPEEIGRIMQGQNNPNT